MASTRLYKVQQELVNNCVCLRNNAQHYGQTRVCINTVAHTHYAVISSTNITHHNVHTTTHSMSTITDFT